MHGISFTVFGCGTAAVTEPFNGVAKQKRDGKKKYTSWTLFSKRSIFSWFLLKKAAKGTRRGNVTTVCMIFLASGC